MHLRIPLASAAGLVFFQLSSVIASAQPGTPLCHPSVSNPIVVASPQQRYDAGQKAEPPLTDQNNGFAWPDTPIGIIKTANGYEFFASDGSQHSRQT